MNKIIIFCCCGTILKRNSKNHFFSKKHIDYLLNQNLESDAYKIIEYIEII